MQNATAVKLLDATVTWELVSWASERQAPMRDIETAQFVDAVVGPQFVMTYVLLEIVRDDEIAVSVPAVVIVVAE